MTDDTTTHAVCPSRLASGAWCHRAQKTIGQGDIAASYSGDRIGMGQPIRKPFAWRGALWVNVGGTHRGSVSTVRAYRLLHPDGFNGPPVSYSEKTADGDAARADPNGFYHGMRVRHAGETYVLCGPPVTFTQGEEKQRSLF